MISSKIIKFIRKLQEYQFIRQINADMFEVLDTGKELEWNRIMTIKGQLNKCSLLSFKFYFTCSDNSNIL